MKFETGAELKYDILSASTEKININTSSMCYL